MSGVVEVERRIRGTPEEVFAYFVDPAKHVLWQGTRAELDPSPGGIYAIHFNADTRIRGEFVVVDPPNHLVFTWGWESTNQFPSGTSETPAGSTKVEITFEEDGTSETIVRVRHSGLPTEHSSEFSTLGWGVYLERLETLTQGGSPGVDPSELFLAS